MERATWSIIAGTHLSRPDKINYHFLPAVSIESFQITH